MRGFGWTDAPTSGYGKENLAKDLLAVCDALGIERFALVGHDWGGFVAFITAIRAPERADLRMPDDRHEAELVERGFNGSPPLFVRA